MKKITKERFFVKKPLPSVPNKGIVEQTEQNGELRTQQADRETTRGEQG